MSIYCIGHSRSCLSTVIGDDPHNPIVAAHKAIMSGKEFLEETFAIEIHDISHAKILSCQMKQNQVVSSIEAFIRRFHSFLKEYQSSINHLDPILTSASQYTTNVFTEISKSRSLVLRVSVIHFPYRTAASYTWSWEDIILLKRISYYIQEYT
jgi:hypothetical protein